MNAPLSTEPPQPLRPWLLRAAALLGLALGGAVLAHFSMATHPRFLHLPWSVDSQNAILERRVFVFEGVPVEFPSWRNRVLVPLAMRAITAVTPASSSQAYLLVRWASACAALAAFTWLVRTATRAGWWLSGGAALVFALSLFPTFLHLYEVPSDFLDAAFFSLLLGCLLQRRRLVFAGCLLLALLNRESAIFALIAWWAVHAWPFARRNFLRESAFCLTLGVAGTALVMGVRQANAMVAAPGSSGLQPFEPAMLFGMHWNMVVEFLRHPNYANPLFFLGAYLAFVGLVAAASWSRLPAELRRLGWTALALYVVSVLYGNIDELRINIPALVVSTLLLAWLAFRDTRPEPGPAP
ncbi:hypothetical protein [Opitutus sp. GAS368]|uniref:hypothetical protein n=1 Tax=Opitutus sp. GAS368 TaxID=1882749 RepID=UPI00087DEC1E|nr:hypothetical protein [Opitutus sp. GAS368]SDS63840.1 hypothetical protein SAMN05444173_3502 [Opitutus sp. GAS368]